MHDCMLYKFALGSIQVSRETKMCMTIALYEHKDMPAPFMKIKKGGMIKRATLTCPRGMRKIPIKICIKF